MKVYEPPDFEQIAAMAHGSKLQLLVSDGELYIVRNRVTLPAPGFFPDLPDPRAAAGSSSTMFKLQKRTDGSFTSAFWPTSRNVIHGPGANSELLPAYRELRQCEMGPCTGRAPTLQMVARTQGEPSHVLVYDGSLSLVEARSSVNRQPVLADLNIGTYVDSVLAGPYQVVLAKDNADRAYYVTALLISDGEPVIAGKKIGEADGVARGGDVVGRVPTEASAFNCGIPAGLLSQQPTYPADWIEASPGAAQLQWELLFERNTVVTYTAPGTLTVSFVPTVARSPAEGFDPIIETRVTQTGIPFANVPPTQFIRSDCPLPQIPPPPVGRSATPGCVPFPEDVVVDDGVTLDTTAHAVFHLCQDEPRASRRTCLDFIIDPFGHDEPVGCEAAWGRYEGADIQMERDLQQAAANHQRGLEGMFGGLSDARAALVTPTELAPGVPHTATATVLTATTSTAAASALLSGVPGRGATNTQATSELLNLDMTVRITGACFPGSEEVETAVGTFFGNIVHLDDDVWCIIVPDQVHTRRPVSFDVRLTLRPTQRATYSQQLMARGAYNGRFRGDWFHVMDLGTELIQRDPDADLLQADFVGTVDVVIAGVWQAVAGPITARIFDHWILGGEISGLAREGAEETTEAEATLLSAELMTQRMAAYWLKNTRAFSPAGTQNLLGIPEPRRIVVHDDQQDGDSVREFAPPEFFVSADSTHLGQFTIYSREAPWPGGP